MGWQNSNFGLIRMAKLIENLSLWSHMIIERTTEADARPVLTPTDCTKVTLAVRATRPAGSWV